ncbi:putative cellulase [Helianthus annuus]|uniref:Cellulase n=1 Tax=Helianthus annuus TaxID=4232 RepID=A0A251TAS3_HELAN|nr:putative cellulase [Helianthus annuus]KAJ0500590.1 putative cellulase [Helianthus annuus]KAJ0688408.1 putative cellulase [Helianthus annuus]KAJ0735015.1 putative cellulase [Helianthus annuus]KAJ0869558.1 putative cellulase [Helianthus annuus]
MPSVELRNALVAKRWSTDYLLKTVAQLGRIIVQVETQTEGFRMSFEVKSDQRVGCGV